MKPTFLLLMLSLFTLPACASFTIESDDSPMTEESSKENSEDNVKEDEMARIAALNRNEKHDWY